MIELFRFILSPQMGPYTVLLSLAVMYWIVIILGAIDLEFFDIDFDLGGEGEGAADAAAASATGIFQGFGRFLNLGTVPVGIVASFVVVKMWLLAFGYYAFIAPFFNIVPALVLWLPVFVVALFSSLLLTGLTTIPLRKVFSGRAEKGGGSLVGEVCTVCTSKVTEKFGQAHLERRGPELLLNVVCNEENRLAKGSTALIIAFDDSRGVYEVKPFEN